MRLCGLDSFDPGYGPMTAKYENGAETSGSIKCWEILK
jgi:hypothetical protein